MFLVRRATNACDKRRPGSGTRACARSADGRARGHEISVVLLAVLSGDRRAVDGRQYGLVCCQLYIYGSFCFYPVDHCPFINLGRAGGDLIVDRLPMRALPSGCCARDVVRGFVLARW